MIETICRIVFWVCIGLYAYILIGHGLLLAFLSLFFKKPVKKKNITPHVCFIIPAYNEERLIEMKIQNTLELDYPADKLEIVIVSDASSDRTDEIVRKHSHKNKRIKLLRQQCRQGRTNAINLAFEKNKTEIFAISDADIMLKKTALTELVANFTDPTVGAATARFIGLETGPKAGNHNYWGYEQLMRHLESSIFSVSFISGALNALRSEHVGKSPPDVTHDHYTPAYIAQKGLRTIYEPLAIAYETYERSHRKEFAIGERTLLMGINFMRDFPRILDVCRHPWFIFNLLFRKILRWFSPLFLLISWIASLFIITEPCPLAYIILTGLGLLFMVLYVAIKKPPRWLSAIGFFTLSQAGLLWGTIEFLFGKRIVTWEPPR